jgi:opacity protein-like surface antigen
MKRIAIITLAALITLSMTAPAFAKAGTSTSQDTEIDGSVVLATAPASGFDTGLGITVGAGTTLPHIDKNLQGRVDISYFTWSASQFGVDVSYTRIPLLFSGRYFVPTRDNRLKVYIQGGLELSFDKVEAAITLPSPPFAFGTVKESSSETRIGLVPGAGIEYKLSPTLGLVVDARWHIITDGYLTVQFGLASHF